RREQRASLAKTIGPGGELLAAPSRGCRRWVVESVRPAGRRRCKQRPSKQCVKPSPSAVAATTERSPPKRWRAMALDCVTPPGGSGGALALPAILPAGIL